MSRQRDPGATRRLKPLLAGLLSFALGVGMLGAAPAMASPTSTEQDIDATPTVASSPVMESSDNESPEPTETVQEITASEKLEESANPSVEEKPTKSPTTDELSEVQETSTPKAESKKSVARDAVTPALVDKGMLLEKTVTENPRPKPGEFVTYSIKVGCSSTTQPCDNAFLMDLLPEPLVFEALSHSGFKGAVEQDVLEGGTQVKLTFNETTPDRPGQKGLNAGTDYTITIVAKLPADTPPEFKNVELVNKAELTSANGKIEDEAEAVSPDIDWAPNAEISKNWAQDSLLQNSNGENLLTLGGIKNTSKSGAVALKITEPSGSTTPFDAVAFTGFGEIVYPQGADALEIRYTVKTEGGTEVKTLTAAPNAPPVFPEGTDLSAITGFVFEFTSSESEGNAGGIVANGTAGAIELNTKLRDSKGTANVTVNNETSIVAELPKGVMSRPVTAKDSFVVEATQYSVDATKQFIKDSVVAGDSNTIGDGRNTSGVKLGITNTSNRPLTSLSLKEPADGSASPFGNGIDFAQFTAGTWPQGATSGVIRIAGTNYQLSNSNGQLVFPDNLPKGNAVTSFEVIFEGEFQPGAGYNVEFDVVGVTAKDALYSNTVLGGGTFAGGKDPVTDEATDTLKVDDPTQKNTSTKGFTPSRIEGIPGDKTTANLNSRVDSTATNVDVRKIVQTDDFSTMTPDFKATSISVPQTQGATSVVVRYKDAGGQWNVLATSNGTAIPDTAIPAGATAVDITYDRENGSFPSDKDVQAKLNFEVVKVIADVVGKSEISNILGVNNGENVTGTADVDKVLQLTSTKEWESKSIVQKPSDMFPKTTLKLSATNTSTYGVDKLSIVDPKTGADNPFDYLNMTGFSATVTDESVKPLAYLKLFKSDGSVVDFSGEQALNPTLQAGTEWAEIIGFDFGLLGTDTTKVPRDTRFDVAVPTQLREKLRNTETPIDTALESLSPNRAGTGYLLPNTAHATIERAGDTPAEKSPASSLEITTDNSVDLNPILTKKFTPSSTVDFFDQNTGNPKAIKVDLSVNSGKHKADYVQIEDRDATFWNTFDFAGWAPQPSSNVYDVTIEYLTGATFDSDDAGNLDSSGGTWSTTKPADADIHGVRVTLQGRDFAELPAIENTISFNVMPRYTLRSGDTIALQEDVKNPGEKDPLTVENTASAQVSRLGKPHKTPDASGSIVFNSGKTVPAVEKSSDIKSGQISPGNVVNYTITVKNNGTDAIVDPVITDQLPFNPATNEPNLILEPEWESAAKYTLTPKFTQAPADTVMTVDRDKIKAVQTGSKVSFTFPEGTKLYPGESYTIVLPTTVRAGLPAGSNLENRVEFMGTDTAMADGTSTLKIIQGQAYASQKLVREVPQPGQTERTGVHNVLNPDASESCYDFGNGFYRYPCLVETKPGGISEWSLSVTNTGNVNTDHLEILDIFPFPGDTGVTVSQKDTSRESQWTPMLLDIEPLDLPEGATAKISYMIGDPLTCKPNGTNPEDPWDGCDTSWVDARPANAKDIHGIKVIYDFEKTPLKPNESVSLSFTMQSATDMPKGADELAPAWNSFGYAARAVVDEKVDHRSQEPIKTGITFRPVAKEKVSVGDYVWVDTNRDGLQSDDEKGIKDVVLTIVGPDGKPVTDVFGNPVLPTMTDANGFYTFENLPVLEGGQTYTVKIDQEASKKPLAPYIPTIDTAEDRGSNSSTWTATTDNKEVDLTKDGARDDTLDFGFVLPKVSVGDYVWVDTDRDGVQGDDEQGIPGVVLELTGPNGEPVTDVFGNPVLPTTTDENGLYTFENLPVLKDGESYTVTINREEESTKAALAPYIPTVDTGADRETNSSTWVATSEGLTKDGDRDSSLDFGFVVPSVSVGDYVWFDSNKDGIQDENEKGIEGVVLILVGPTGEPVTDVNGKPVGPMTTDANGKYDFSNLPVLEDGESYTVKIDQEASKKALSGYMPTVDTGADRETNSSTWVATSEGLTKDGQRDPSLDFGFVLIPKVSVGDYVWVDTDRDGVQGDDEPGIPGVVLELTGPNGEPVVDVFGKPVTSVTTDENGLYTFENLPVLKDGESYTVTINREDESTKAALEPYIPTVDTGADRGSNSSTWMATTDNKEVDLTKDGARDETLDFGFVLPKVSVGDYVWVDTDRDGVQGDDEQGIPGVVLELTGPNGEPVVDVFGKPVGPVKTDENGLYTFENLPVLEDGESYTVTIKRDDESTKAALAPYIPTVDTGADRETNSSTWVASSEGLTEDGERDSSLDFGFVLPKVSVGDYVWVDTNRDGLQGDDEPGIPGVVLELTGPNGEPVVDVFGNPVLPTMTDENGNYTFENLPVLKDGESYTVTINREDESTKAALAPYIPTIDTAEDRETNSSTWEASSEGLTEDGERDSSLDFGFVLPKVSVGDYVWVDTNRDGLQGDDEQGIPGVVLELTGPNGEPVVDVFDNPVLPTMTDENGFYTFGNLPVLKDGESYTVSIDREASQEPLAPYIPTIETEGNRGEDSSTWVAMSEGLTEDGQRDPSLDFGFVLPKVSLGDYVWVDTNRDGVQDEDEKGIPGVVLELTGPNGEPVVDVFGNPVGPMHTDANGKYDFSNLPVLEDGESYTVKIDQEASKKALSGYMPTVDTGADRETNSSTWVATSEGLTKDGDRDPSLDFGFVLIPKVSVGDYVWVDENRDGVQDEGEKGIKDVVLTIVGPDGEPVTDVFGKPVGPVKTDENGKYTFENLPVLKDGESYTVKIDRDASKEPLAPYVPTIVTDDNRENDSSEWEATTEGLTEDGNEDLTLDFGFVLPKVSVGDYVWVDENRDGVQDEGEKGIKDVVLTIVGPDGEPVTDVFGKPVGPEKTDENGKYTFENLPVLEDGESYTVTIKRDDESTKAALAPYIPTVDTGADRETNSSTWVATSEGLTKDGERDSSLDFGFVLPKVSVGDKVWVDENGNGRQDEGEPGIPGVVLDIFDPNGEKIGTTTTDKNGNYTFENLPVLEEGEFYTVTINQEDPSTQEALKPYKPTVSGKGDREGDSSEWTATSEGLTEDGQRDPSLDFGFVLKPSEPEVPTDPSEPSVPTDPSEPSVPTDPSEPSVPTDPSEPAVPSDSTGVPEDPQEPNASEDPTVEGKDNLASTGFTALSVLIAGLLLAAAGVLITRRSRGRHS